MKIIGLSDCHITADKPISRLDDNILKTGLDKLEYVFNYAFENGIISILQAGDLFDVKRDWSVLSALTKFLEEWQKKGINLYSVSGNHDQYHHQVQNEKTTLGVLVSSGLITRLGSEGKQLGYAAGEKPVHVYGASWGESLPISTYKDSVNILVIHRQILMSKVFKQQTDCDYAPEFLKQHKGYDLILTGDAHQKFHYVATDKRQIINTGVMMRLEATKAMIEHQPQFVVYDTQTKKIEWINIPAMKGRDVLTDAHLIAKDITERKFDAFIDMVENTTQVGNECSFDENLDVLVKEAEKNGMAGIGVVIEKYFSEV
jgi:DNA repair exonuclease SbcCD nuclease subunit